MSLYFQVICAIILGVLLAISIRETGTAMRPLGDAFIKLIKMIIAPIISAPSSSGSPGWRTEEGREDRGLAPCTRNR